MSIIKLKILNHGGQTLAASPAGENVSLVYAGHYQPGDWIALEGDGPALSCEIQLEDSMPRPWSTYPRGTFSSPSRPRATAAITPPRASPEASTCSGPG